MNSRALATHNFTPVEAGDLGFQKGDILTIHEKNEGWWFAELNGQRGNIPCTYVQEMAPAVSNAGVSPLGPPPPVSRANKPLYALSPAPDTSAQPPLPHSTPPANSAHLHAEPPQQYPYTPSTAAPTPPATSPVGSAVSRMPPPQQGVLPPPRDGSSIGSNSATRTVSPPPVAARPGGVPKNAIAILPLAQNTASRKPAGPISPKSMSPPSVANVPPRPSPASPKAGSSIGSAVSTDGPPARPAPVPRPGAVPKFSAQQQDRGSAPGELHRPSPPKLTNPASAKQQMAPGRSSAPGVSVPIRDKPETVAALVRGPPPVPKAPAPAPKPLEEMTPEERRLEESKRRIEENKKKREEEIRQWKEQNQHATAERVAERERQLEEQRKREEEQLRQDEIAELKRQAEEKRRAEQEEAERRRQEDLERRRKEEAERKRREQEEAERKRTEEAARRKREQEEADRRRQEQERRELERKRKAEEEKAEEARIAREIEEEKRRLIAERTAQQALQKHATPAPRAQSPPGSLPPQKTPPSVPPKQQLQPAVAAAKEDDAGPPKRAPPARPPPKTAIRNISPARAKSPDAGTPSVRFAAPESDQPISPRTRDEPVAAPAPVASGGTGTIQPRDVQPPWEAVWDEEYQRYYYWNRDSDEVQWVMPESAKPLPAEPLAPGEKWRYIKRDEDVELYRTRGTLETKYDQTDQRFLPKQKSSKEEERLQRDAARKEREIVSPPRVRPQKIQEPEPQPQPPRQPKALPPVPVVPKAPVENPIYDAEPVMLQSQLSPSTRFVSPVREERAAAPPEPTPVSDVVHYKKDDEGPYYRLKIIGHEERAEKFTEDADISKKKKVTMYKIQVQKWYKGQYTKWIVWRRYNQFYKLNDKLRKSKLPVGQMPPKEFDKFDPKVVEGRVLSLDEYLQELTKFKSSSRHEHTVNFLEPTQLGDDKAHPDPDADW